MTAPKTMTLVGHPTNDGTTCELQLSIGGELVVSINPIPDDPGQEVIAIVEPSSLVAAVRELGLVDDLARVERERDELLRLVSNIREDLVVEDEDGMLADHGVAGSVTQAAASLMVAAVRLHDGVETGIFVEVDVDGRTLDIIAQWRDSPVATNWVAFASDLRAATKAAESERDKAIDEAAKLRETMGKRDDGGPR